MERSKKIVQVSILGIIVNAILVAFKATVGVATGSVAILMDAVNNLSDALSSVITIVGTKLAGRSPDKKHPYGYGQIEHVSSVTIAVIVLIAGLTSFKESFEKILQPEAASYTAVSLVIIAVAVVVKFLLGQYTKRAGKKYHSEALVASGAESIFDCVISLSTLAAAGISLLWGLSVEGWLGALISLLILKTGVELLLDSLSAIIGARVDSELSTSLKARIREYPGVLGAYDLVLHRYGPQRMIGSVHVELPDGMTAKEIHNLTGRITQDVHRDYGIVLTVGIYASNTEGGVSAEMKGKLLERMAAYPEILQMHGFYVDEDRNQVSFDLVIDFKSKRQFDIRDSLIQEMKKLYPAYDFTVILDSDFSD